MKIGATVATAMLASLVTGWAMAAEPEVVADPATGIDAARLETFLRLELPEAPRPTRVTLQPSARPKGIEATATFDDGSVERRSLDLTDIEPAEAARIVALALAEACRTHVAAPKLETLPRATAPRAPTTTPRPSAGRSLALGATLGAGLRVLATSPALGPEIRAGATLTSPGGLVASAGASYVTFSASDPLGAVRVHAFGGYVGLAYGATLGARARLSVGPRVDVGLAAASASPEAGARADTTAAPTLALSGELLLEGKVSDGWAAGIAVDAGSTVVGLDLLAGGREVLVVRGASLGARLVLTMGGR